MVINGVLYFVVSTRYVTAVYFARVSRIRADQPYIALPDFNDRDLMEKVDRVREAFSGEDGLWSTLQESIGNTVTRPDGSTFDYREFCTALIDEKHHVWFLRLMDFYREIGGEGRHEKLAAIDRYLADASAYVQRLCTRRIRFFGRGWIYG